MSIYSERINKAIKDSGYTYQELENITGVKKSSLQRYATGTTTKIPLEVIKKLSNTLGVTQEYLLGWESGEEKKNDLLANIIIRLRSDGLFKGAVENLYNLDGEKLQAVNQMLSTLFE